MIYCNNIFCFSPIELLFSYYLIFFLPLWVLWVSGQPTLSPIGKYILLFNDTQVHNCVILHYYSCQLLHINNYHNNKFNTLTFQDRFFTEYYLQHHYHHHQHNNKVGQDGYATMGDVRRLDRQVILIFFIRLSSSKL